jgi:hypothetical protein
MNGIGLRKHIDGAVRLVPRDILTAATLALQLIAGSIRADTALGLVRAAKAEG